MPYKIRIQSQLQRLDTGNWMDLLYSPKRAPSDCGCPSGTLGTCPRFITRELHMLRPALRTTRYLLSGSQDRRHLLICAHRLLMRELGVSAFEHVLATVIFAVVLKEVCSALCGKLGECCPLTIVFDSILLPSSRLSEMHILWRCLTPCE